MKKIIIKILWWIKYTENPYENKGIVEFMIGGMFTSLFIGIPSVLTIIAWIKGIENITEIQKVGSLIVMGLFLCYWFCAFVIYFSTDLLSRLTKKSKRDIEKFLETEVYI